MNKTLNFIFFLGVIFILIGLIYALGYSTSIYFKYIFSIGFFLLGIGVFGKLGEAGEKQR